MEKKRFNTNIREDKLLALKKIALQKGIGANDMIENLVDMYLDLQEKSNYVNKINFSTQLNSCILEQLRKEGLHIGKNKILLERKWLCEYKQAHIDEFGIYREENVETFVEDTETKIIYLIRYNYMETTKTKKIEEIYFSKLNESKQALIKSFKFILEEKIDGEDLEKELHIDNAIVKMSKCKDFTYYTKQEAILYNV